MISFLTYTAVRFASFLANCFPVSFTLWMTARTTDWVYGFLKERRQITLENINRVFGDSIPPERKTALAKGAFRSAALSMVELLIVRKIARNARERFSISGDQYLEEAFAKQKGVVMTVAHFGSWEYLPFLSFLKGRRWSVVVKNIKNPHVNRMVDSLRRVMRVHPISKDGSIRTVLTELKKGHGVAILIDQWAGDEGIWVDFFGTSTSTTSIPARLAKHTGCALVPAYCLRRSPGQYEIHVEKPYHYDTKTPGWEARITTELNQLWEHWIRLHPDQWLWGHRRWKDKPRTIRTVSQQTISTGRADEH
ncbi:MAG TPA: lysophospholipid acyltransferase family protein [Candidatus Omnitrophota bacterium]|jgi:KDO2-lipid IV(A) lauroyltransferase|nr:lysophospholipid acyltransferase family protein [Candidatus Omnitrophota bacterium]